MAFATQALVGVLVRLHDDNDIKIEEVIKYNNNKDNRRSTLTPEERIERRLAYAREYYHKNKDKRNYYNKEKRKEYYTANREHILEQKKEYRARNTEKIAEYRRSLKDKKKNKYFLIFTYYIIPI